MFLSCLLPSSLFSVDRNKYQIHIPLPPKIDPTVTMMQVRNENSLRHTKVKLLLIFVIDLLNYMM